MFDIVILKIYQEPTQWCSDITIDGNSIQLTLQEYPPDGPAPGEDAIMEVANRLAESLAIMRETQEV